MLTTPTLRSIALFPLLAIAISALPCSAQTFVAVASPAIASHIGFSTGAAWVDYDGDGDLDLYVVTAFGANNDNVLYRNDGGGVFTRITAVPLTSDGAFTVCSTWADVDNDGDLDCFVSGLDSAGGALYRSSGGGVLTLDPASGVTGLSIKATGCAFGDYDADGHVDLVLSLINGALGMSGGNRLFHNDGDGTFTEINVAPFAADPASFHHPTWTDFDGDGDLDVCFASGGVGALRLDRIYRNLLVESGIPDFVRITTGVFFSETRDSQVLSWVDYDNDGDLDCYAINYASVPNQLYRNDGAVFTKITTGDIVTNTGAFHAVAWGDYDNDADLDVYVVRDNNQTNRYYRNNNDGTFTSITTGAFVTTNRSEYGVANADFDEDGDLDLFLPNARSEAASTLYRNDLAGANHWLKVHCTGGASNRSGIGAKVRVKATVGGAPRWQMRELTASSSYGGNNALDAHFGLGDATTVDSLRIEWPGGHVDVLTNVAADQLVDIEESPALAVQDATPSSTLRPSSIELVITPNPVHVGLDPAAVEVRFEMPTAGLAHVALHDIHGRLVSDLETQRLASGRHKLTLELPPVAAGVYFVRLRGPRGSGVERIIVVR